MKRFIFFAFAATFASACLAEWTPADEDLENCMWRNGYPMSEKQCADIREEVARFGYQPKTQPSKKIEMGAEELAALYKQREVDRIEYQAKKAQEQAAAEEKENKRIAEIARQEAENKRNREQMARDEEKEEVVKKRKCGKDYMALRVGMTLERIDQCYEEPAYVTGTVSKGGVVETYRGAFYFIYVQNGRVVGYTRRRF